METKATKKVTKREDYKGEIALKRARVSGIALKASTARSGGIYEVKSNNNGTSTVLNGIFKAYFPKKKEVNASLFGEVLTSLFTGKEKEKDAIVEKGISGYEKTTGRKYKNFPTLRSRLISEIKRGNILSFKLISEPVR
jgi:hypothetical protein